MHEVVAWFASWYPALHVWARAVVGIILWFWVVSGAIFVLRFLAFVLLDKNGAPQPLAAASNLVHFPIDRFHGDKSADLSKE